MTDHWVPILWINNCGKSKRERRESVYSLTCRVDGRESVHDNLEAKAIEVFLVSSGIIPHQEHVLVTSACRIIRCSSKSELCSWIIASEPCREGLSVWNAFIVNLITVRIYSFW